MTAIAQSVAARVAPVRRAGARRYAIAVAALLAFAFGDGLARGLQAVWGLTSPYQFLFPLLLPLLLVSLVDLRRLPRRMVGHLLLFAVFSAALLVIQLNLFRSVNTAGLLQLLLFVLVLVVVADMFAEASESLTDTFRRGIVIAHYGLVGYLIVELVVFWVTGRDVAVTALITGSQADINLYYGFRPAGLSQEPQWAAFALIASFLAVYLLVPQRAMGALITLVIASAAVRSATALIFVGALVLVILLERTERGRGRFFLITLVGVVALVFTFSARVSVAVGGNDGSTLMRVQSAQTAWNVAAAAFPSGVGYGNFQRAAVYSSYVAQFIADTSARYYKSDVAFLNYFAEMGFGGAILYGWVALVMGRARHALVWTYFGALSLLAGTLLIPSVVIVAAAAGLAERERRVAETAEREARSEAIRRIARGHAPSATVPARQPLVTPPARQR